MKNILRLPMEPRCTVIQEQNIYLLSVPLSSQTLSYPLGPVSGAREPWQLSEDGSAVASRPTRAWPQRAVGGVGLLLRRRGGLPARSCTAASGAGLWWRGGLWCGADVDHGSGVRELHALRRHGSRSIALFSSLLSPLASLLSPLSTFLLSPLSPRRGLLAVYGRTA